MVRPNQPHIIVKQTPTDYVLSFPFNQKIISVVRVLHPCFYHNHLKNQGPFDEL
jgi:hypothetical protein